MFWADCHPVRAATKSPHSRQTCSRGVVGEDVIAAVDPDHAFVLAAQHVVDQRHVIRRHAAVLVAVDQQYGRLHVSEVVAQVTQEVGQLRGRQQWIAVVGHPPPGRRGIKPVGLARFGRVGITRPMVAARGSNGSPTFQRSSHRHHAGDWPVRRQVQRQRPAQRQSHHEHTAAARAAKPPITSLDAGVPVAPGGLVQIGRVRAVARQQHPVDGVACR